jgi:hypothetical protein
LDIEPPSSSPFIVGLAGHPDLDPAQVPQLLEHVSRFLKSIRQHLPATDIRLMIDARVALSLPIASAARELDVSIDACADGLSDDGDDGDDLMTRRCSLLLALWDGQPSTAPADTADRVFRFLGVYDQRSTSSGSIEIRTVADEPPIPGRHVYWVPTAAREPCYLLAAGDRVLDAQHSMPSSLKNRLKELNDFNRDFQRLAANGGFHRSGSLMRPHQAALGSMCDAQVLASIDVEFMKADSLAGYMQRQSDRLFNVFGIMAFSMALAYLVYDKIDESQSLLVFYMIVLLVSLIAYYFLQSRRWLGKYLSYRALAETLRVRFYLTLACVARRRHTKRLLALTGIERFPGFGWISFALDAMEPVTSDASFSGGEMTQRSRLVDQAWIDDQCRYFARKVASMERHRRWIGRMKRSVFAAALIVLSLMFVFGAALHHIDVRTGLPLKNILTFISSTLAVVLGVWELRQNKMAVQELLWQYRNQLGQFQRARMLVQRTSNRGVRDEILEELGENSLMEVYLWAIHRYHREHAPPAAP